LGQYFTRTNLED